MKITFILSIGFIDIVLDHCNGKTLNLFRKKIKEGMWGGRDHNLVVDNGNIVKQELSWESKVDKLIEIYNRLVND